MNSRVTIVYVANCVAYATVAQATLWVVQGLYDADRSETPDPDEFPGAVRVYGPDDASRIAEVENGLSSLLRALGYDVHRVVIADD